jgi:enoyl-CoA hydratase/carnithine racemase
MTIRFEIDEEGVATITIDRPERMNALDDAHYAELSAAWLRVRDDSAVRAAIITGAGDRSFTAGADLKGRATLPAADFWLTQKDQLLNRGLEVWKPVIAAVNGHCLGGGMTLLFATDLRVAATHATFGLPEVRRGILPANGGTQRILEQLPHAVAMELLLTGEPIDAATALRWGLVNAVVPGDKVLATAREYASKIVANAPLAVQAAKELAIRARQLPRDEGFRLEQAMNKVLRQTDDAREGAAAFVEKRPPRFSGG